MAQAAPALTVTLATPAPVVWPDVVSASGAIAPWQEASIGTQIGSYQLIDVAERGRSRPARPGPRPAESRIAPDRGSTTARGAMSRRDNTAGRKSLKANGAVSEPGCARGRDRSQGGVGAPRRQAPGASLHAVLAPDDGVITARTATWAGRAAGQELFRMIRQNRLEWRGELTAPQLKAVVIGQRIALEFPDGSTRARGAPDRTAWTQCRAWPSSTPTRARKPGAGGHVRDRRDRVGTSPASPRRRKRRISATAAATSCQSPGDCRVRGRAGAACHRPPPEATGRDHRGPRRTTSGGASGAGSSRRRLRPGVARTAGRRR